MKALFLSMVLILPKKFPRSRGNPISTIQFYFILLLTNMTTKHTTTRKLKSNYSMQLPQSKVDTFSISLISYSALFSYKSLFYWMFLCSIRLRSALHQIKKLLSSRTAEEANISFNGTLDRNNENTIAMYCSIEYVIKHCSIYS